jgi:hypothetical protein
MHSSIPWLPIDTDTTQTPLFTLSLGLRGHEGIYLLIFLASLGTNVSTDDDVEPQPASCCC